VHELSLCRSIASIVERAADGRAIATIHLDVGELRQVVPATLEYCWGVVSETSPLEGSRLAITRIPGVVECTACGVHTRISGVFSLVCDGCGGTAVTVLTGEEFLVRSLDLKE